MGKIAAFCLFLFATASFAQISNCLMPPLGGVTWKPRSAGIQNRPGDGVYLQLGGRIASGTLLSLGRAPINPDPNGDFLVVLPLVNRPDAFDWIVTKADGSLEAVRVRYEWTKPFAGFEPSFSQPAIYPPDEWLAIQCENNTDEKKQQIDRQARRLKWAVFSVNGFFVFADAGRYSLSPEVQWTPHFELNPSWEMYLSLAATIVRYDSSSSFLALETDWVGKYRLHERIFLGLGAGAHWWVNVDRLSPHLTAVVSVPFEVGEGASLREVFGSFGHYFSSSAPHEVVKLGARVQF